MGQQVGSAPRPKGSWALLSKWYWKIATLCSYRKGPINLGFWKLRGDPLSLDLEPLTSKLSFVFISPESNVNYIQTSDLLELCIRQQVVFEALRTTLNQCGRGSTHLHSPKRPLPLNFLLETSSSCSCHTVRDRNVKGQRGKNVLCISYDGTQFIS